MNKKILALSIFVILLILLIIFLVKSDTQSKSESSSLIVGNTVLVNKLENLYNATLVRDLTLQDISGIDEMVKGDDYGQDKYDEVKWFIENNEQIHLSHSITALEVYASTGQKIYCMPHEMSHIRVYMKHNAENNVKQVLEESDENLREWQTYVKQTKKTNPSYFSNYEEINTKIKDALSKLKNGDRSKNISSDIYYIETYGVC